MSNSEPSPWVARFVGLVAPGATVLDLACGTGRHTRLCVERGLRVTSVDRDLSRLGELRDHPEVTAVEADLEAGAWPLEGRHDLVIVTNYLHRPRFSDLLACVGDVLVYETFAAGNERFGRPRRADYLLAAGELLELVAGELQVLAYEYRTTPESKVVQRIAACRRPLVPPPSWRDIATDNEAVTQGPKNDRPTEDD